uniref:Orfan n=1 Tax=Strongyloides stercoralis TaxID=6248 RepID=A0A913HT47_STRER
MYSQRNEIYPTIENVVPSAPPPPYSEINEQVNANPNIGPQYIYPQIPTIEVTSPCRQMHCPRGQVFIVDSHCGINSNAHQIELARCARRKKMRIIKVIIIIVILFIITVVTTIIIVVKESNTDSSYAYNQMMSKSENCFVLQGQYTRKDGKEVTINATKNWLVLIEAESGNKFVYTMPIKDDKIETYITKIRVWFFLFLIFSTNIFFILSLYYLSETNMDYITNETYKDEDFYYYEIKITKPDELFIIFYNLSIFLSNLNLMSLFFLVLTSQIKNISIKQKFLKMICDWIININTIFLSINPYIMALIAYIICLSMIMYMFCFGITTWVLLGLAMLYVSVTAIGFKIKISLMKNPLF